MREEKASSVQGRERESQGFGVLPGRRAAEQDAEICYVTHRLHKVLRNRAAASNTFAVKLIALLLPACLQNEFLIKSSDPLAVSQGIRQLAHSSGTSDACHIVTYALAPYLSSCCWRTLPA